VLLLSRRDAVAAPREVAVLAGRGGEPPDQFGLQFGRLDDGVDDQLAGQPGDVDVALVLLAPGGDERGPLGLVGDGGDLCWRRPR
jgi:hypothetical protein